MAFGQSEAVVNLSEVNMKAKDLIEKLRKFDPEIQVFGYSEANDKPTMFELTVSPNPTRFRRNENGGLVFLSPTDKNAAEALCIELDELF
jgi:hypothetical protein